MDHARTRSMTEKGTTLYEDKVMYFQAMLKDSECKLDTLISPLDFNSCTFKDLAERKKSVRDALKSHNKNLSEFREYLERINTENSNFQITSLIDKDNKLQAMTTTFVEDLEDQMVTLSEHISLKSSSTLSNNTNDTRCTIKRTEARVARVRMNYAERRATLLNKKAMLEEKHKSDNATQERKLAELEVELDVLNSQQEAAIVVTEANAIENDSNHDSVRLGSKLLDNLPNHDPTQHVANYILRSGPVQNNSYESNELNSALRNELNINAKPTYSTSSSKMQDDKNNQLLEMINDITKFLLRKDLMSSRLTNFDDKPETYRAWKASFKAIISDIGVTPTEQIDLLVKFLGPNSRLHAISLRSVYVSDPISGCDKIWERLDDRYGSPEMIKYSVVSKLNNLPKISEKEPQRYYDLVDILVEIEAVKNDSKYQTQMSYFDSSEGIRPVVDKLPFGVQEKWITRAAAFKRQHDDVFPPFSYLVNFISEIAKTKNDPALSYHIIDRSDGKAYPVATKKTDVTRPFKINFPGEIDSTVSCPIHNANHSLLVCRAFKTKSLQEKRKLIRENFICFKCLDSNTHRASNCTKEVSCYLCGSNKHLFLMHDYKQDTSYQYHNGEDGESSLKGNSLETKPVQSKCTQICGNQGFRGRSCAKIVLVDVYKKSDPSSMIRTYAILDDQSNRSLASPELFSKLAIDGVSEEYTLHSCSGPSIMTGRKAFDCIVKSCDGSGTYELPPLLECPRIPNSTDEIPTPEVVSHFSHLKEMASKLPPLDTNAKTLLLIGRDMSAAHHVHEQVVGFGNAPFGQRLSLGWVVVGQICLGAVHYDEFVNCNKTFVLPNGRSSVFAPCHNNINVKETLQAPRFNEPDIFVKTRMDEKIGTSVEDREFLQIMESEMKKDASGCWIAPLPFRTKRSKLPNNRSQALKRAISLHHSLTKDPRKQEHFITFMEQIIDRGHAEIATELENSKECWYLPLFGVYHPKKPDKLRSVFDASAKFQGVSLNDVLMQGPDLINNLLGILLRFRKEKVAISADIEQMFYSFLVEEKHRDFLRFFWYKNNDPTKNLVEYRMKVHVFGNRPSPAVANLGLRKTADASEQKFGSDVKHFVSSDFYVDDGLTCTPTIKTSIDLMKRTQDALLENGNLRLHKIASNSPEVLASFPQEDLAKDIATLDLSKEDLPIQRSLGLYWKLDADCLTFHVSNDDKPFTRRGVLSVINSLYDPLGIVAPVTITGKIFLKKLISEKTDWDEPLPRTHLAEWKEWTSALSSLEKIQIPRPYVTHSLTEASSNELLLFSDASESAIASVAYLISCTPGIPSKIGFVMGKAKVAPSRSNTIPRLELCAAVLSVEIADFVLEQLDLNIHKVKYYSDSKIVLGYICNRTRRFYTYVSNRVERILSSSESSQWHYINTKSNPADLGSRGVSPQSMANSIWLSGPPVELFNNPNHSYTYPLQGPDEDKEIRPHVLTMKSTLHEQVPKLGSLRFENFSSLEKLSSAICKLQHICKAFNKTNDCSGWHICLDACSHSHISKAQKFVISVVQREEFPVECSQLEKSDVLHTSSPILSLNPFLDQDGLLRVGGRLNRSELPTEQKHPIIIPTKTHLSTLLIRQFHEQVLHQGRHFTEGAIRAGGFWLIGGKRQISSYIFRCVQCRKMRGKQQQQIMADLPEDRLTPAPPFTYVGVDICGPWAVVTRKTRGGQASSKRWAVLFTCLTIRAIHVELVEEMSSSAFINALRRFISIRGNVREFRSDRGTNFVGSTSELGVNVVNVEDGQMTKLLKDKCATWIFNPPHASHMGGIWERMIGIVRRILDSMLSKASGKNLTHDVLVTLMAEAVAIINSRPIVPVASDGEAPEILSPATLLTQKMGTIGSFAEDLSLKDIYHSEWKHVQILADSFWRRWKSEYLSLLQPKQKWKSEKPNLTEGDVVLMKDESIRNQWPLAIVVKTFPSSDNKVRTVKVKVMHE